MPAVLQALNRAIDLIARFPWAPDQLGDWRRPQPNPERGASGENGPSASTVVQEIESIVFDTYFRSNGFSISAENLSESEKTAARADIQREYGVGDALVRSINKPEHPAR